MPSALADLEHPCLAGALKEKMLSGLSFAAGGQTASPHMVSEDALRIGRPRHCGVYSAMDGRMVSLRSLLVQKGREGSRKHWGTSLCIFRFVFFPPLRKCMYRPACLGVFFHAPSRCRIECCPACVGYPPFPNTFCKNSQCCISVFQAFSN